MTAVEIEIRCSDYAEHRHRLETRSMDIAGLQPVTWGQVITREYEPWNREHLLIDTAGQSVHQSLDLVLTQLLQATK